MRRSLRILPLLTIAASTLWLTACGGSSSTPPPPTPPAVSVSLSPTPPTSLLMSATTSLTATVANDSKNAGVTWTVTCGSSACGSFAPASTASGAATTYTAPAAIPTNNTVTVTATSVSDTTKSASGTITITASTPGISVALTPTPPSSLVTGTMTSLTAVVSNDSKNAGVTWTVTCGSSACGSFAPASTASGTATIYTAPAAIPTNNTVIVTATSVSDTTKSASGTITITASTPTTLADGTYVYHFSGYDDSGPSFIAGAFTVKGGAITGGEQDFSDAQSNSTDQLVPSNSSISIAGHNLQIVLATANSGIGVNGVLTLRGARVSSSRVLVTEFDTFASATGSIDLQTSTAAPSGGYAFSIAGWDLSSSTVTPFAIGGVLNISGTTLSVGGSVLDYNLGGSTSQAQTFSSGTVSAPDSFGRVSFNLTPSTASLIPQFILTGYIVGTGQIQLVESQTDTLSDDLGGMALGQGANAGKFSLPSIANTTYVFGGSGEDIYNLVNIAGGFVFGSSGSLSGSFALNDFAHSVQTTITSGTYSVDPTGRVTLSNVITGLSASPFTFQFYLDGNGNALELGIDDLEVTTGPAYKQTATSTDFSGTYALGGQGYLNSTALPVWGAVGPVTVKSDNLTGSTDYNAQGITPASAVSLTGTENSSTGQLSLTGIDALAVTTARTYGYYPIDTQRVLAISIDPNQLGLLTFEGTGP